jgi:hypothetical protein
MLLPDASLGSGAHLAPLASAQYASTVHLAITDTSRQPTRHSSEVSEEKENDHALIS